MVDRRIDLRHWFETTSRLADYCALSGTAFPRVIVLLLLVANALALFFTVSSLFHHPTGQQPKISEHVASYAQGPSGQLDLGRAIANEHLFGEPSARIPTRATALTPFLVTGILYSPDPSVSRAVLDIASHAQVYAVGSVLPDGEKLVAIQADQVTFDDAGNRRTVHVNIKKAPMDAKFNTVSLTQLNQPWSQSAPATGPGRENRDDRMMTAKSKPANPFQQLAPDPLLGKRLPTVLAIRRNEVRRFKKILPPGINVPVTHKPETPL